ncbi:MAG: DJ-1/PfpI family protein [bacterium]
MAKLTGKNVLMVIAPEDFRDEELATPKAILEKEDAKVTVASTRAGTCEGMLGARVTPDTTLAAETAAKYDAIVVVGGGGSPAHLWGNTALHSILRDAKASNKVIAGICLSGAALARAGVLAGKNATVWRTDESIAEMREGKAKLADAPVVVDGRVVTANGPDAANDFGRKIAQLLGD